MSNKPNIDPKKVREFPKKEPFVPLTRELLSSDAWRSMSINCRKLIDFLLIEHMNHAGRENGNLMATYKQLKSFGVNRIHLAIKEAEDKGLICVEHGMRKSLNESSPNRFLLTFLKEKITNEACATYYAAPSHSWKHYKKK